MPRSAVDVGTNSVRLLVLDDDGSALARHVEITRLGQGVDASGRLAPDALDRTLSAIGGYRSEWERLGSPPPRIAATSAVRDAENRDAFFDGVREVAGVEAEVLSGEEEARLAFLGAVGGGIDVQWPPVVVDIGGGSTELILGGGSAREPTVAGAVSLQLGSVRLTERCLAGASDPPTAGQVREAHDLARTRIAEGVADLLRQGVDLVGDVRSAIGVAGTITTLVQVHLGRDEWVDGVVHGTVLTRRVVAELARRLAGASRAEVAGIPGIAPGRRDVIAGGAIVLHEVMEVVGLEAIVASEADILDGLARS